jgi:hypothetical protein
MKNGSCSRHEEEVKYHSKRESYGKKKYSRSATRNQKYNYSSPHSRKESHMSNEPMSTVDVSLVINQIKRHEKEYLQGDLRNTKSQNFDGENKRGEDFEA